jgi:hypothetical protein
VKNADDIAVTMTEGPDDSPSAEHPTPGGTDRPAAASLPLSPQAVHWEISSDTPDDPFSYALLLNEPESGSIGLALSPLLIQDMAAILEGLRAQQIEILLGHPAPPSPAPPSPAPTTHAPEDRQAATEPNETAPPSKPASWWLRHKILAVMIAIILTTMLISFLNGASRV